MTLLRLLLGGIFLFSACSKLFSTDSFELYIFSMGLADLGWCALAARLVIGLELILGSAYLLGIYRKTVNWTALGSLILFSLFLGWRIYLGDERSCHCMGEIVDLNPFDSLVKNVIMAVMMGRLAFLYRRTPDVVRPKTCAATGESVCHCGCDSGACNCNSSCCGNVVNDTLSAIPGVKGFKRFNRQVKAFLDKEQRWFMIGIAVISLILPFLVSPVVAAGFNHWFNGADDGSHYFVQEEFRPHTEELGLDQGRKVVCFYSTSCEFCQRCAKRMSRIIDHYDLPVQKFEVIFMQSEEDQETASRLFFKEYGQDIQLPFHVLHPYDFIPLTSGNMPLVILMEDGQVVKELDLNSLSSNDIVGFLQLMD